MDTELLETEPVSPTEVVAVRYGTLATMKSAVFYRYAAHGEPDVEQQLDYYFWVVRVGGRTIVVDTGFEPECGRRRGRTCLLGPKDALEHLGIDAAEVAQVVITHFHYDHIGNVDLFPNAELIVAEQEFEFYTSPMARRLQFWEHVEGPEIDVITAAHREGRVRLVNGRTGIAPGVTAVTVGGHAPGQQIVLIEGPTGDVVLASDAAHLYEELELDRPFSVLVDLAGMYETLDHLRELERNGAIVVPGHDPEVVSRFPTLGGDAAGVGYRIM